ncbi:NADP-dependent malic enzyme [Clostridium botulinum]|uniref:Malate dehydrogenase (Oxaloacetate-decarboxylating) n=1 Tax=Clostridium botulinum (strain Langeland / NCTC 10281 / Type F) TaxID=441772 RepID=A7G9W3_CLOBL|nr:NADP-dependent malic enzyme [Clostridium botulinum]ABS41875.1 malate dehydrogenase (oxaloacetate-decarboxylating) [Clostridium botulinum F str. Langeland]ADF98047.1 malate dehydrogenase (oxaloacetate-decarboxylating) [Clostridium botulinum F str. 230613]KKM41597.1 malate dehydrogenase [Clostridium botulinum]MBD5645152.1 NADP-dependent malic enzyme [Clostridium botulinum]MBY6792782.1 NADP-dependent malic enzyme [Clostridium botulinum]
MDIKEKSLMVHKKFKGKLSIEGKIQVKNKEDLSIAYTPGVAEPCVKINEDKSLVYEYTMKGNTVAVVTNGTAVLGLGDIGPYAGLPVMEGKALLFKEFADIDSFPICIDSKEPEEIIKTVKLIAPGFGGINLEDIKAPECFYIEKKLKEELDIPVFHDDQHGTAIVVLAGIYNALRLVGKKLEEAKIVINGAGSAGISICKLLLQAGAKNIIMCDKEGSLVKGNSNLNEAQKLIVEVTNKENEKGTLKDVIKGKDVFIGVSAPNILTEEMVNAMNKDSIVFAMANPTPEIMPDKAKKAGARVVATGRSDFPNQINNVLVFPGIFRGALDVRSKVINEEMKLAASKAIAFLVQDNELNEEYIIPGAFDKRVAEVVAEEVKKVALKMGLSKL